MTKKLKMHGGYTLDRVNNRATYWTCGHTVTIFDAAVYPPLLCKKCEEMTEAELELYIVKNGIRSLT